MSLRRPLSAAAVLIAIAAGGCGAGGEPLDTTGPGFLQSGTEFWDGWTVPAGTVLIGSPFPLPPQQDEGMPEDVERVRAEFLLTGDPHEVMRDVFAQIDARGLRAVLFEDGYDDEEEEVCSAGGRHCSVYGRGADGYTKVAADLSVDDDGRYPHLTLEFGAYSWRDLSFSAVDGVGSEAAEWIDAEAPQGSSDVEVAVPEEDGFAPGSELPFFGRDEPLGEVPEGARLLVPPYNPSSTYGFAGIFSIEDEAAVDELAAVAAEAATGDLRADEELAAGDLRSHHVSYDGSGGGCGVDFDTVAPVDGPVVARLRVVCD